MKLIALILSFVALVGVSYADVIEVRHYRERPKVRYVEPPVYYVEQPRVRVVRPAPVYYVEQPAPVYYVEKPRVKCRHHCHPKSHFFMGWGVSPYVAPLPFIGFEFYHHHHHHGR